MPHKTKSDCYRISKVSQQYFVIYLIPTEIPCDIRDLPKKKFAKVLHRLLSDILKREDDDILRRH